MCARAHGGARAREGAARSAATHTEVRGHEGAARAPLRTAREFVTRTPDCCGDCGHCRYCGRAAMRRRARTLALTVLRRET